MADEIVDLAISRFIGPDTGALREFFNEAWTGPPKGENHLVEPGHQFEWAWLLVRHRGARSAPASLAAARRLYGSGVKGVVPDREVACDEPSADLSIRSARARL
jgi:mannose/cellobiose epimerase-like protein (N-acyl-D-glucosamine 2-epimerase family)